VNAANAVYMRSRRERSSTDNPIARIRSDASSADTAWTFTAPSLAGRGHPGYQGDTRYSPAVSDQAHLRQLPAVHVLADAAAGLSSAPRWAVVEAARRAVATRRAALLAGQASSADVAPAEVAAAAE